MAKLNKKQIEKKLFSARLALLHSFPFYSLMLSHVKFIADANCKSISCYNNDIIYLPEFVETLDNNELMIMLMHLVLHLALGHPFRKQESYDAKRYDLACDIVVNSNILQSLCHSSFSNDWKVSHNGNHLVLEKPFPHLSNFPYLTPNQQDGFHFTADQVYRMLAEQQQQDPNTLFRVSAEREHPISAKTPDQTQSNRQEEAPSPPPPEKEPEKNSPPKKKKGNQKAEYNPQADQELQDLLQDMKNRINQQRENQQNNPVQEEQPQESPESVQDEMDDHTYWQGEDEEALIPPSETWSQRCFDLASVIDAGCLGRPGSFPAGVKRQLDAIMNPVLDWRRVLHEFIEEEICDYSFSPPDKRLQDCPFFLPDFNETEAVVKKILFAVDTSGSMSNQSITRCYSEIYHAILQFNGKLEGYIGYFDSAFTQPIPFSDIEELGASQPIGGGGTEVEPIFEYVATQMQDDPPVSIIILTDGELDYPEESIANGIPVLWVLTGHSCSPPWGTIISIEDSPCNN